MARIVGVGPTRFLNGLNTLFTNLRRSSSVARSVLAAIREDQDSILVVKWQGGQIGQTQVTFTGDEQRDRQSVQQAYAPDSPIPHQAGHIVSYRGIGGGARQSTVRISLTRYIDNRILQVSFTHELVHGLRQITGSQMYLRLEQQAMNAWDNYEEFVACAIENVMRSEQGLALRVAHNNRAVDPFFEGAAPDTNAAQQRPDPPGGFAMRDPGPTYEAQVLSGETPASRYVESIASDRRALARLAEGFADRYRRELRLVRDWHRTLVNSIASAQSAPFNPFRHI